MSAIWSEIGIGHLFDLSSLEAVVRNLHLWLFEQVLVPSTLVQLVIIALAFLGARFIAPRVRRGIDQLARRRRLEERLKAGARALSPLTLPVCWLTLQWLSVFVAAGAGWPHHLIRTTVSLLTAWVVIRLTSSLVRHPVWAKAVAITVWTIAALNILKLLQPTVLLLDQLALSLGGLRISALTVVKAMLALAVLLWLATFAARLLETRIRRAPNLTPSIQVLFSKLLKIVLVTIAIVVALGSVGIDLTAFAVFSGAVGVGIGFGLQKVVANLISGVILLLDRSVKPGDVIAVGGTYGWIDSLGARYVSVVTRDGIEHLIPNEELITTRVENWSYSNNLIRLRTPIGISYGSDVRKAMALCLAAAAATGRVLKHPEPVCLLTGFGDSSVDLELRFWINDPASGTANVRSAVLLNVWDRFREHGIEIPFPQRDLHIRSPAELRVLATATAPRRKRMSQALPGDAEPVAP